MAGEVVLLAGATGLALILYLLLRPVGREIALLEVCFYLVIYRSGYMPRAVDRHMTDDDLKAMYAYFKMLTPVSHRVDNSLSPTTCPVCGPLHGGGDRNQPAATE